VENERSHESGFSGIEVTAALAILILVGSIFWQTYAKKQTQDEQLRYSAEQLPPDTQAQQDAVLRDSLADMSRSGTGAASASTSPVTGAVIDTLLGTYATLKNEGTFTDASAAALGKSVAPMVRIPLTYPKVTVKDILPSADVSEKAGIAYQQALHGALSPLRENTIPEFEFLARYLETKDPSYLTQMRNVALLYRDAASNTARLIVPSDVVSYHVAIINSLEEFSATLNALATYADDPIGSVSLLRSYNIAEQDVLSTFNALRAYYANKTS
jgi:hypothetical protein